MNQINEALLLLSVGMGTVFVVLLLVIFVCRCIILLINRWFPEQAAVVADKMSDTIPAGVIAAITSAVNIVSGGKAKIVKIEKNK